jgi:hypothetical protein
MSYEERNRTCVRSTPVEGEVLPGRIIPQDLKTVWSGLDISLKVNQNDCTPVEMSAGPENSPSHAQSYLSPRSSQTEMVKTPVSLKDFRAAPMEQSVFSVGA